MLYTFEHEGVARSVAVLARPDILDHVGELSLIVLMPGGNQTVEEFMMDVARVHRALAGESMTHEDGSSSEGPRHWVVVAPVSMGWDRLTAGDWSTPIGQTAMLFQLDDVSLVARLRDLANEWVVGLCAAHGVSIEGSVFQERYLIGFSGGGCMTFRVAYERPGLFDGYAVAGTNCAGFETAWQREIVGAAPQWAFGPPASAFRLHVTIDPEETKVYSFGADEAGTPPDKMPLPDTQVSAADSAVGFTSMDPLLSYGPSAYYPLQMAYDAPLGLGAWTLAASGTLPVVATFGAGAVDVQDFEPPFMLKRVRLVQVQGIGHTVPKAATGFDWLSSAVNWLHFHVVAPVGPGPVGPVVGV